MPEREKKRTGPGQPDNVTAIFYFEMQCSNPELDQLISKANQQPGPPTFDLQFCVCSVFECSSFQRKARGLGNPS